MSVLFEEEDFTSLERSAENVIPVSVYDGMIVHHESLDLNSLQNIIENAGGEIFSEGYHV